MDRVRKAALVEQNASAGPLCCAEIFFGLAAALLFAEKAHAYGDPGSGALLWQLLLAAMEGHVLDHGELMVTYSHARAMVERMMPGRVHPQRRQYDSTPRS